MANFIESRMDLWVIFPVWSPSKGSPPSHPDRPCL